MFPTDIPPEHLVDALAEGVIVTDNTGRVIQMNRQAREVAGFPANSLPKTTLAEIFPELHAQFTKALKSGIPFVTKTTDHKDQPVSLHLSCLETNIRSDSPQYWLCSLITIPADQGNPASVDKDLTRQLEAIFNASSDGIWVCDGEGVVLRINAASEQLNGISSDNVIGKTVEDLLISQAFDQSVTSRVMRSRQRETVMQRVPKTGRYLLVTGTPAFDREGKISLIIVNERDLTELNNLQQRFEQTVQVKEKIEEELTELSLLELQRNTIVADSGKMRHLLQMSLKLSHLGASNILILGESGTGKGLLAKLIHKNSKRKNRPFIEINCAALPENLLEAELFGYEKGAFTGAHEKGKVGLFELAHQGTLFLDEIGDMPLPLQAKLLKYLDNNEFRRVGGTKSISISCTTIAATNLNLREQVKKKEFREDLFYRLSSFVLNIPPLRERPDDISGLVRLYLNEFNTKYKSQKTLSPEGIRTLQRYSFPGNTRELRSIIENGVVMTDESSLDDFIVESTQAVQSSPPNGLQLPTIEGSDLNLKSHLEETEKQLLLAARKRCTTTREMAALLGISQPSIVRKLARHKIN